MGNRNEWLEEMAGKRPERKPRPWITFLFGMILFGVLAGSYAHFKIDEAYERGRNSAVLHVGEGVCANTIGYETQVWRGREESGGVFRCWTLDMPDESVFARSAVHQESTGDNNANILNTGTGDVNVVIDGKKKPDISGTFGEVDCRSGTCRAVPIGTIDRPSEEKRKP